MVSSAWRTSRFTSCRCSSSYTGSRCPSAARSTQLDFSTAAATAATQEPAPPTLNRAVTLKRRDEDLDVLFKRIYEDMVAGRLSPERFDKLSSQY